MKANERVPVVILVRVSTDNQSNDRQIDELTKYAESKNYDIVEVVAEKMSGRSKRELRSGLDQVEELAEAGTIQKVLVHEVSRLGRRSDLIMGFAQTMEDLGVSIYWHAQGVETLLPNGKRSPVGNMMLALLAELARSEADFLSERTKSGLERAKRQGKKLGRKEGAFYSDEDFLQKHKDIVRSLKSGQSVRNTAAICGKGVSTVKRVKKALVPQAVN